MSHSAVAVPHQCRPLYRKRLVCLQIIAYQSVLNDKLNNIVIPYEAAVLCTNRMCKVHHSEIGEYAIIISMIDDCRGNHSYHRTN